MRYITELTLKDDSFFKKILIGWRLATNQDEILGAISNMQHISTIVDMKEAMNSTDDVLANIQYSAEYAVKIMSGFFND